MYLPNRICDERPERGGAELASLLPSIPKDRLMIETDAPYLVPRTIKPNKARPGRNEPALLPHVLQVSGTVCMNMPCHRGSRFDLSFVLGVAPYTTCRNMCLVAAQMLL